MNRLKTPFYCSGVLPRLADSRHREHYQFFEDMVLYGLADAAGRDTGIGMLLWFEEQLSGFLGPRTHGFLTYALHMPESDSWPHLQDLLR